jgi:alginate O-acetyltransferase complex protein AlgI
MLFISFEYLALVLIVLLLYWRWPRWQNQLLLVANLAFFWCWDARSAALVLLSATAEWWLASALLQRAGMPRARAALLWASVAVNLALWLAFKHFDFFRHQLAAAGWSWFGPEGTLPWVVPLGISFWTLQKLSYTLDVYLGLERTRVPWLSFVVFTSFFATAMSGPIEKSRGFLPQLARARTWSHRLLEEGCWLIALGLFKKVFLAGHCQLIGNEIAGQDPSGTLVWLRVLFYALELYGDFSGYSDMARGVARLFGLDIQQNFKAPYFSRSLSEYWQRWHVSLYTWLSSYVFAPANMAWRHLGTLGLLAAIWLTFLLSGLWHGFGWTYVAWGAVHALGISLFSVSQRWRKALRRRQGQGGARALDALAVFVTFNWVCLGYLFFNAADIGDAWRQLGRLVSSPWVTGDTLYYGSIWLRYGALAYVIHRLEGTGGEVFSVFALKTPYRVAVYLGMFLGTLRFHAPAARFIYQQF